jgi:apolipoprotein D and lipocalin family protein
MKTALVLLIIASVGARGVEGLAGSEPPLETVAHVDLNRYTGKWYEIARYPNRFERKCAREVTAEYSVESSGKIWVTNACLTVDGKPTVSRGTAKIEDETTNAKFDVTFFWPFYGKYWIIDLGSNYEYAVVGGPSREYLWILSRTPTLPDETYQAIVGRLGGKSYDGAKLVKTLQ